MSEEQKKIIKDLADKLPRMSEREKGYLEGTIANQRVKNSETHLITALSLMIQWSGLKYHQHLINSGI